MVILPIRIKETPLENRKILTFKEIKYVILLWFPIHCILCSSPHLTLLLMVATIYLEFQGQAYYQMLPFIISPNSYNHSV